MPTRRIEIAPLTLLYVVLTIAACAILFKLAAVILVLIIGLFLVGTFGPGVDWLEKRGLRRPWAIGLLWLLALGGAAIIGIVTLPALVEQVRSLVEHEPDIRNHLADMLAKNKLTASVGESLHHVQYEALAKSVGSQALLATGRIAEVIGYGVSALFLAIYLMLDRDRLRGAMFALVPRQYHLRLSRVLINLETIVGGYIRGQALTSGFMAVFTFGLLLLCGVPNPLALAAFAGVADILPYVGAALAIAPCAAAAAATKGMLPALIVIGAMLAYQEFESRVIVPRVYGRVLRLPSSMVLLSLLAGGALLGVLGALLALPVAAAIRMLFQEARTLLPGERIDDTLLRERDARAEGEYSARSEGIEAQEAAAIAVEISYARLQEEGGREAALDAPMTAGHPDPRV